MINDLLDVQRALAMTWDGPVRLASATKVEGYALEVQRLMLEQAPAGMPTTVLLKRVPTGAGTADASNPESPAHWLLDVWASLEFMHEIFGEANPLPRLYAGDRQAGWLLMEDLPDNDPLRQALWGSDPQEGRNELVRFMTMLGEMHARALPHIPRYVELRRALGGYIHFLDPRHDPTPLLEAWIHTLAELGFGLPPAALDEMQVVAEVLQQPGDCLTFMHGNAVPGLLAETNGRLRLQECEESGPRHALFEGVNPRMLFPTMALAFVRRFPEMVWRSAEAAYRAVLAPVSHTIADDASYASALTAASVFRAMSGSLWNIPLSLQWALASNDHPHVDDVRRVRLARYDAFVQTATEFDCLPNLRRYFSDLASSLRQRWPNAADELPFYPAFLPKAHD